MTNGLRRELGHRSFAISRPNPLRYRLTPDSQIGRTPSHLYKFTLKTLIPLPLLTLSAPAFADTVGHWRFDAADAAVVCHEDLATVPLDRWAELRLRFQPAFQLLDLGWPVQRLRSEWDREEACDATGIEPHRERVTIWRRDEQVFHRAVDALDNKK